MADTLKKLKVLNIVLAVLLGLSLLALLGVIAHEYFQPESGSAVVSDNYIEPVSVGARSTGNAVRLRPVVCAVIPAPAKTVVDWDRAKETVISVYKNHAEDSTPFYATNMFPGDRETKTYLVEVSHRGTVTVRFRANIRPGYEKLAEVLLCKVVLRGEDTVLYDGLMRDMPASLDYPISSVFGRTTSLTYDITVSLDTSVGNAYMNKELIADFRWWVEESGSTPVPPPFPPIPPFPVETTTGGTPNTTDSTDTGSITRPDGTTSAGGTMRPGETAATGGTSHTGDTVRPEDTTSLGDTTYPGETTGTSATAMPGTGELIEPPQTGDPTRLGVCLLISLLALFCIILLLGWKQRKGGRHP